MLHSITVKLEFRYSNSEAAHSEDTGEEVRQVALLKPSTSSSLGIGIIGGNASGIFISQIEPESIAALQGGIRIGDHILEVYIFL